MYKLVTPRTTFPVTAADCKAHSYIENPTAAQSTLVDMYLAYATDYVERQSGLILTAQTWELVLPCWSLRLEKFPVASVTSVKYYDDDNTQQTLNSAEYYVLNPYKGSAYITPVTSFPSHYSRPDAITVRFVAGFTSIPGCLSAATLLAFGGFWENRESEVIGTISTEIKQGVERLCRLARAF